MHNKNWAMVVTERERLQMSIPKITKILSLRSVKLNFQHSSIGFLKLLSPQITSSKQLSTEELIQKKCLTLIDRPASISWVPAPWNQSSKFTLACRIQGTYSGDSERLVMILIGSFIFVSFIDFDKIWFTSFRIPKWLLSHILTYSSRQEQFESECLIDHNHYSDKGSE